MEHRPEHKASKLCNTVDVLYKVSTCPPKPQRRSFKSGYLFNNWNKNDGIHMAHAHAMSSQVPLHKNMKVKACVGQNYLHLTVGLTVNCQCQVPKELTITEHTDRQTHAQTDTQTSFSPQIPPPPLHTHKAQTNF